MYGPGALAMVINITTDNANTFKGFEVSQRVGAIEEFYTTEFKYGHQLKDGAGLFLYGGISEYPGASSEDAPLIYGGRPDATGQWSGVKFCPYTYNEKVTSVKSYNAEYDGMPKIKLHGEYTKDNLDIWLRYTQGGENVDTSSQYNITSPFGIGYRQATGVLNYKQELADNFALKYMFSYMHTEVLSPYWATPYRYYGEDDYYGQIIADWKINENHEFAFGGAWRHDEFGRPLWGGEEKTRYLMDRNFPVPASVPNWYTFPYPQMPRWRTDMLSLFGEYQWRINNQLTAFVSAREDDHTYTTPMFSPRLSLVYTPTNVDTLKLIASRSVRTESDAVMRASYGYTYNGSYYGNRANSQVEVLKAYEARYERKVSDHILLAADAFIHNQNVIGWVATPNPDDSHVGPIGTEKLWGVELEASYVQNRFRFDISHGFTKLLDFKLASGIANTEDTAAPTGYGHDLANWFNNISKMRVHYQVDDKLSLDSSLIVYWDNPGGEDYAKYRASLPGGSSGGGWDGNYDPRARNAFYNNWYLNLGLQYQYSKNLTMRVDAYDILGLFDESLNKRREGFNTSAPAEVRIQPAALGFQVVYKF
jgi:outer membrane receptor for ferrienterochelin and colicins